MDAGTLEAKMRTTPRIGVLAYPFSDNYGAVLLAYAIQKALADMGEDAVILGFDDFLVTHVKRDAGQMLGKFKNYGVKRLAKRVHRECNNMLCDLLTPRRMHDLQKRAFRKFREDFLHLMAPMNAVEDLAPRLEEFPIVMVGGDQIWNISNIKNLGASFFLDVKTTRKLRKVSYAPCFGLSEVPPEFRKLIGDGLRDFDFLGVRNRIGQKIVKDLSGRAATINVDPTLLVSFDDVTAKTEEGKKQIVFYCIKTPQSHMFRVRRALRKTLACKVLSLSLGRPFLLADKWAQGAGPAEWLAIFRNAEYVFTDSFHGTIFAIKNRKPFLTLVQDATDGRMLDLLSQYGLEDRIVHSPAEASGERMLRPIDYDRVHEKIARDVQASYAYLKTALA